LPQAVQSAAFSGVIFKIENLDKSPDTEINGQKVLQYILLPQKPDSPIPRVNISKSESSHESHLREYAYAPERPRK
jgi:hypothetical protein